MIAPSVRAFLYTWGGRKTAEGEKIPVRIEELDLGYIDGMLLLPLVVEHTIDERSPIYGHTYDSLTVSRAPHLADVVAVLILLQGQLFTSCLDVTTALKRVSVCVLPRLHSFGKCLMQHNVQPLLLHSPVHIHQSSV